MAFDRMARRGERADQILAFNVATKDHFRKASRSNQAALAHRARLSGSQTRGRARAFRRARLAWLPPPRHAVHRGLRIPGLRETIPPSGSGSSRPFKKLTVPNGYRPRGSAAAARTSHPKLDCDHAAKTDRCHRAEPLTLSLLHPADQTDEAPSFVTQ